MTIDELVEKVYEMRRLQTEYFRTRTRENLMKAKEAEHGVDSIIDEYRNPQQHLF